jgi:hypothetical protein
MNTHLAKRAPAGGQQIRRIFDNNQIIEKFGQWLLICGKAKLTLWPQSSVRNS